jgi:hypothetical protein
MGGHVTRMGDENIYNIVVGKPEGERILARLKR